MKRNKLSILVLAIVLIALVPLSACSDKDSASDGGKDTIEVWAMGEEGKKLGEIKEKFEEENEGLKVNVQAIPWGNAHDKLLTAVASGEGPDVVQLGTTWVPEFADAGAILDLSDYMDDYPEFAQENYFEGITSVTNNGDEVVGIPWYVDTRVLYYRTDTLKEVGYDKAPATWDELQDAASKLAARGDDQYGLDIDQNDQITPFIFAWQNGYEADLENNDLNLDSPEFIGAIEYYNSFFKNGYSQKETGTDIIQGFSDESKPMFFSGPWMISILNDQAPDIKGKWATAVMPKKETNTSSMGGSVLSVFKSSDNVDNALKFISYMSEVDTQLEWLEISNTLPARTEAWEDEALTENANFKVFGEQLKNAKPGLQIESFERIAQELLSSLERINVGGEDLQKEMENFNKEALKIYGK